MKRDARASPDCTADTLRRLVHDLRTPLNSIRLSADLLRRAHARGGGAEAGGKSTGEHIGVIERQITAIDAILARAAVAVEGETTASGGENVPSAGDDNAS